MKTKLIPRWFPTALTALGLVCFAAEQVRGATPPIFEMVTDQQGLPPVTVETLTNGFRLRFAGLPGRRYSIQRATAATGPWTSITNQLAPPSSLLQYDDLTQPPGQAYYRTVHTNTVVLSVQEFLALPSKAADARITYGTDPNQFGDVRVPSTGGPHPVAILIHGGCWSSFANLRDMAAMGDALKAEGIASWNIEYRRLGQAGSGWPGTYLDVGKAIDHLRTIAPGLGLDLTRVIVVGHSAGASLAMWAAARSRLPVSSAIYVQDPLEIYGAINLGGTADMEAFIPYEVQACGSGVVESLLGGSPTVIPPRYAQASALKMLPLGLPQIFIWGRKDDILPVSIGASQAAAVAQSGDPVLFLNLADLGHFETPSVLTPSWPVVRSAIKSLLAGIP